ncbi:hypothetical protein PSENEW3n2_00001879 [Picochlorum sp. SENEW3]|nr:hypothetical protein PSENEW3n2_00001879 [Picochlorum sp. SENEW3]WPT14649.1 hypothetical protein PSENEW3_00001879 [Picochlorum sp. SENEW3]
MQVMPFMKARRGEMSTRVWNGIARTLTLSLLLLLTLICILLALPKRNEYVILSPLHESRVKEGARITEEFVFQPMFDLSAINAACNLNIPEEVFTTCRNKVYPILNKVTNQTQMGISPRIHVLGERHSATNLAAHLVVRNFELVFNKTGLAKDTANIDYGINKHKHEIQKNGTYEKGLSIISIKNPYDYTRSMLKECYNCGPQEKNRGNPAAFVGTEWHKGDHVGQYHFENLMVMRKEKYCNYLEKAAELTDCIMMVHSEDNVLPIHQEHYVWRIATMTGWPLKEGVVRTKSDYSGHVARGESGFQLSKLVDGITYFKRSFSEHEENVIHAVNENMIDDFEKAFGYHRIKVPEKPPKQPGPIKQPQPIKQPEPIKQPGPIKQPEPIKQPGPIKQPETIKQPEVASYKVVPLEKNTPTNDDTPLASILDLQLDKISNKALEDIQHLQEVAQNQGKVELQSKEDEKEQAVVSEDTKQDVAGEEEKRHLDGTRTEVEGQVGKAEHESEEETKQERLERLQAILAEYARRREKYQDQHNL